MGIMGLCTLRTAVTDCKNFLCCYYEVRSTSSSPPDPYPPTRQPWTLPNSLTDKPTGWSVVRAPANTTDSVNPQTTHWLTAALHPPTHPIYHPSTIQAHTLTQLCFLFSTSHPSSLCPLPPTSIFCFLTCQQHSIHARLSLLLIAPHRTYPPVQTSPCDSSTWR